MSMAKTIETLCGKYDLIEIQKKGEETLLKRRVELYNLNCLPDNEERFEKISFERSNEYISEDEKCLKSFTVDPEKI
jgi:hypothetical protein